MNWKQAKTLPQSMLGQMDWVFPRISLREVFFGWPSFILGGIIVFFIILLKSKTTVDFWLEPYFFIYAIFVIAFALSRIFSAMLYQSSFASLLRDSKLDTWEDYEPTVAFIIPCKNEEENIAKTINKCFEADYPKDKIEVIVINDGSTDRTLEVLKKIRDTHKSICIYNWNENQGKRWGMAAGFVASKSDIIIQLDSDSYIDPKTLRDLVAPFRNEKVAAVCAYGEPKNADANIITRMQAAYYFMSFKILKAAESSYDTVFCCSGCCSAYRKKDVMPILYDWLAEKFLGRPATWGDDRALTSWLLKEGKKTVFASKALAYTIVPENFRQLMTQQLRWKKSWIVNFLITSRFIFKKQPFVSVFYYFPLIIISLLTPIVAFRALIYAPIFNGIFPFYHIIGLMLLTALLVVYYRYLDKNNKYWPYLFLWSLLTFFVLSFVIVWAAIKIQDRGWGTR